MQCMIIWQQKHKTQTKFLANPQKPQKLFQNLKPSSKCMKCMKEWEKEKIKSTYQMIKAWFRSKSWWVKRFFRRKGKGRERREKDRDIWMKSKLGWTSSIYRNRHLDRLRRCRELKLDRSKRYQGGTDSKIG